MLDDHARRLVELFHALPGRVGIGDVVVREILALHLPITGQAAGERLRVAVEGGALVRVLAVAQILQLSELQRQHFGIFAALAVVERREVVRHRGVIRGGVREHFARQRITGFG